VSDPSVCCPHFTALLHLTLYVAYLKVLGLLVSRFKKTTALFYLCASIAYRSNRCITAIVLHYRPFCHHMTVHKVLSHFSQIVGNCQRVILAYRSNRWETPTSVSVVPLSSQNHHIPFLFPNMLNHESSVLASLRVQTECHISLLDSYGSKPSQTVLVS